MCVTSARKIRKITLFSYQTTNASYLFSWLNNIRQTVDFFLLLLRFFRIFYTNVESILHWEDCLVGHCLPLGVIIDTFWQKNPSVFLIVSSFLELYRFFLDDITLLRLKAPWCYNKSRLLKNRRTTHHFAGRVWLVAIGRHRGNLCCLENFCWDQVQCCSQGFG